MGLGGVVVVRRNLFSLGWEGGGGWWGWGRSEGGGGCVLGPLYDCLILHKLGGVDTPTWPTSASVSFLEHFPEIDFDAVETLDDLINSAIGLQSVAFYDGMNFVA